LRVLSKEMRVLRTPSYARLSTYWSARRREGAGMDDGFLPVVDNGVGRGRQS